MKFRVAVILAGLLWASGHCLPPAQANQEQTQPAGSASESEQKKDFGSKYPFYLEVMGGSGSSEAFSTSVDTTAVLQANNFVTFEEQDNARFVLGWTLPGEKGAFRLVFNGFKETDWSFASSGRRFTIAGTAIQAPEPVEWWSIQVENGVLVSQAQQPTWDPGLDDDNGNGFPDIEEIRPVPLDIGTTRDVVGNLQNQTQTLEFLFQQDWGGRMVDARWGAGIRYFVYEGNLPVAAWLRTQFQAGAGTQGFTEGAALRLVNYSQDTSGFGPTGYAELRFNFFRERLRLYLQANAAFVLQDMETDSGTFIVHVRNITTDTVFPAESRLTESRSKDVWQTGAEAGVRIGLVPGLKLRLAYFLVSYQDAILLPRFMQIPETLEQVDQGVTALYATKNFEFDGWRVGFSFQF